MRTRFTCVCLGPFAVLLFSVYGFTDDTTKRPVAIPGQRVFVTGHSFHAWVGGPLQDVARLAGIKDHRDVGKQALGGSRVIQHWNLPDERNEAKQAIRAGKVDVLTVSPHFELPDQGIDEFAELLLKHSPNGRVLVQASWLPLDFMSRRLKKKDIDTIKTDDIRAEYKKWFDRIAEQVRGLNKRLAEKQHRQVVFLVPVGHAVYNLCERIAQGKVPGVTTQASLFSDGMGHPRPPVIQVLTAYCFYVAIYQRSPVGLGLPAMFKQAKNPALDEKCNRVLQEIAWETVQLVPPDRDSSDGTDSRRSRPTKRESSRHTSR